MIRAMWAEIINELLDAGLSQGEIARRVGCSQPYISDLARGNCGKRIGWDLGKKIKDLHEQEIHGRDEGRAA